MEQDKEIEINVSIKDYLNKCISRSPRFYKKSKNIVYDFCIDKGVDDSIQNASESEIKLDIG